MNENIIRLVPRITIPLAVVLIIAIIVIKRLQDREDRFNKKITVRGSGKNPLYGVYLIFLKTPILKKYFAKVLKSTEKLYPADQMSVNKKATAMMLKNMAISALLGAAVIFFSGGDVFYITMGFFSAVVLFDYMISHKLDVMEYELLKQLQSFLSDVRHYYMQSKILEDAIGDTLDDIPFEISLHIQKLYDILNSPIMDEKIEEYTQSDPNRFFLLLTSICTVVKDRGSAEVNGKDTFLESIAYLKEEVNAEILKKERVRYKFQFLSGIALGIVFLIKPAERWALSNMPDLEAFYTGIYGRVIMIAIFIVSFICYKLVEVLRDSKRGDIKRTSIWLQLARFNVINRICNRIINKYYTRAIKLNEDMKEVGDQTGPKSFLIQSAVIAVAAFLAINMMFTAAVVGEKLTMLKTFVGEFDSELVPNTRYLEIMEQTTTEYAVKYGKTNPKHLNEDDLTHEILTDGKITNSNYARMIAQQVIDGAKKYRNTYYQWYYLIISLLGGAFAFIVPYLILKFKIKVATMNKDDEVNQFQTLVLVLMHSNGIKIDDILEWMDRFAYSFKPSIETCITELEAGQQKALEKMKMSETFQPFKRFCDCLLEIDAVGIVKAFDEVTSDRAYSLKDREQKNEMTTDTRASWAVKIAYAPALTMFFLYMIGPMVIYALRMFMAMDFSI